MTILAANKQKQVYYSKELKYDVNAEMKLLSEWKTFPMIMCQIKRFQNKIQHRVLLIWEMN